MAEKAANNRIYPITGLTEFQHFIKYFRAVIALFVTDSVDNKACECSA
jgi:hypothetical protein